MKDIKNIVQGLLLIIENISKQGIEEYHKRNSPECAEKIINAVEVLKQKLQDYNRQIKREQMSLDKELIDILGIEYRWVCNKKDIPTIDNCKVPEDAEERYIY